MVEIMPEKRRHTRKVVNWSATIVRRGQRMVTARVHNASIAGIYLETIGEFEIGAKLLIEIEVATAQGTTPILIEAQVERCTILAKMRGYGYGLHVDNVKPSDMAKWQAQFGI